MIVTLLAIIKHGDVKGMARLPPEHDSPLIVDPDGVVPAPPFFECLKSIDGRNSEIAEICCVMSVEKLPSRRTQNIGWKRSRSLGATIEKQIFCQPVTENLYHVPQLLKSDN